MRRRLAVLAALPAALAAQPGLFPRPQVTALEQSGGFNDEPAMARAGDGSYYVAWISFRDGFDTLQLARYERTGETFRSRGAWQIAGGKGVFVLGPRLAAAGEAVYLVYAQELNRNWEVQAVRCGAEGPGKPVNVSRHPGSDTRPAGWWQEGALWVAWESNRDNGRRIVAAPVRGERAGAAEIVSGEAKSNYAPSIAVAAGGFVSVAWHSFRDNNYDVWMRTRRPEGGWSEERRMTRAPAIDRHAVLSAEGPDLWLAYEHAEMENYLIGRTNRRQIFLGKVAPQGLRAPAGAKPPFAGRSEAPAWAFDQKGRLWAAFLRPREPRGGWDLMFGGHNGERWLGPTTVSLRKGMDRAPSIAIDGDYAVLAFQADDFPETWAQYDPASTLRARSEILLAAVDLRHAPAAAPAFALEPLAEPAGGFEAASLRQAYGEDEATPTAEYQGKKLHLYYGDLHAHSEVSVCNRCGDQSLEENYQHRRDLNRMDFVAMTDHDYNFVPYLWNRSAKLVRANEDPGRLLTFLAEEWTSSFEKYSKERPYGYYGHRNLILADTFFPKWFDSSGGDTPAELWGALRKMKADFVNIPHQLADTGNVPTDWTFMDEEAQPVAEIFQVRGSYEYHGAPRQAPRSTEEKGHFIQDVWERGRAIGVIASPDHGGGRGKAAVWAEDLSREGILRAIRQRRTFGTTAARMALDVRVNGRMMGEKLPEAGGKPVEVRVRARCPGDIERVEVCRNNRFVYTTRPAGRETEFTYLDREPVNGYSFYYVRVIQKDQEIGWSSPVFLGAPSTDR